MFLQQRGLGSAVPFPSRERSLEQWNNQRANEVSLNQWSAAELRNTDLA